MNKFPKRHNPNILILTLETTFQPELICFFVYPFKHNGYSEVSTSGLHYRTVLVLFSTFMLWF